MANGNTLRKQVYSTNGEASQTAGLGSKEVHMPKTRTRMARTSKTSSLAAADASARRAPFPGWFSKGTKRKADRSSVIAVPAHIRVLGASISKAQRDQIRRKLGTKLGKFAVAIERVTVRVKDVNGPRGGIDQLCRIKVVLNRLPSVLVESQHHSLNGAVQDALAGTERAVRRRLQRRLTKPIKRRARSPIGAVD
jgi:hypothetical protein